MSDPPELSLFNLNKVLFTLTKPIPFAIHLGIPSPTISCIQSDHQRVDEQRIEVFKFIGDNYKSNCITWDRIAEALEEIDAGNLAIEIRKNFATNCLSPSNPKTKVVKSQTVGANGNKSFLEGYFDISSKESSTFNYLRSQLGIPAYSNLMVCSKWMTGFCVVVAVAVVAVAVALFLFYNQGTSTDPAGHPITDITHLYKATKDIPGKWESLCSNLHVDSEIISDLISTNLESSIKMRRCLLAFFNHGDVYWEDVIVAIAESPIYNKRLAKLIAKRYGIDFTLLQQRDVL